MDTEENVHDVIHAASSGEEQKPWLGRLEAVYIKHTIINGKVGKPEQESSLPPYFVLNLLTFASGDTLFSIVKIHRANLFRVSPIL